MRSARKLAGRAGALATVCFLLAVLSPEAGASVPPIPNYTGSSVGQGVVTTFAIAPSIFTPLLQTGLAYTQSTLNSQADGQSHSVAAQIFPGSFALGALGCGVPAGWVQANYPPAGPCVSDAKGNFYQTTRSDFGDSIGTPQLDDVLNTVLDRSKLTLGEVHAHAEQTNSSSTVETTNYAFYSQPGTPAILSARSIVSVSTGRLEGGRVVNEVTTTVKDLSLLGDTIKIGTLVSHARSGSDGTNGTADSTITAADVRVLENNTEHEATIDGNGVHIHDAALPPGENVQLQQHFDAAMQYAGVHITLADPNEIVDGASGDASIGGLQLTFSGTIPVVPIPRLPDPADHTLKKAIADVVAKLPTECVTDVEATLEPIIDPSGKSPPPQVPLCFGAGVVPGGGSEIDLTLSVGTAEAFSVGALGYQFTSHPIDCTACFGIGVPPTYPVQPPTQVLGTQVQQPQATQQQLATGPLLGIFARMPSAVLMGIGIGLLILAVGAALGPSLRHGRAR